jgi:outer membrane protein OmpA-like peptidoglycan-associated protein
VNDPGPIDNKGCPYGDLDKDGVPDKEDRCPDTPGPVENKGCPFGDLDGDGVLDKDDECPNTPGTIALKGCPELAKEDQEILNMAFENLEFESGKDIIKPVSYPSLDSLASLLSRKTDWKLKLASDVANMDLSKRRTMAVVNYLKMRRIAEDRMMPEWFGESKPAYPNDTPEGRQKNRRVEMTIKFD